MVDENLVLASRTPVAINNFDGSGDFNFTNSLTPRFAAPVLHPLAVKQLQLLTGRADNGAHRCVFTDGNTASTR